MEETVCFAEQINFFSPICFATHVCCIYQVQTHPQQLLLGDGGYGSTCLPCVRNRACPCMTATRGQLLVTAADIKWAFPGISCALNQHSSSSFNILKRVFMSHCKSDNATTKHYMSPTTWWNCKNKTCLLFQTFSINSNAHVVKDAKWTGDSAVYQASFFQVTNK